MSSSDQVLRLQTDYDYATAGRFIELRSVIHGTRLRISCSSTDKLEKFLGALCDGVSVNSPVDELSRRSGIGVETSQRLLAQLRQNGALVTGVRPAPNRGHSMYDRQIQFLNLFETANTSGELFNQRLQGKSVVVVGLGGYGSWIALLCAMVGIRHIVGVDPDRVEESNLNRQVLYNNKDIGELKIRACERTLLEIRPELEFEGAPVHIGEPSDLSPYLRGVDFVFNAFGYPPLERIKDHVVGHVARASINAGVPSLTLSSSWVGPLNVPGKTPCYWCFLSKYEGLKATRSTRNKGGSAGSLAPRIALNASLGVWEAARFLSGIDRPPTMDGVVVLDTFQYLKHTYLPTSIDKMCEFCGTNRPS